MHAKSYELYDKRRDSKVFHYNTSPLRISKL